MPLQSLHKFEEIIMYLSVLRYIFKSRSKKGLFDLNKKAESFFRDILNLTYGWELRDLNILQTNHPAVDLGDATARIAVQVTAEAGSAKIADTLAGFFDKGLKKTYSRIIILVITEKKNYTKQFRVESGFSFSRDEDIKDIDDLLTDIERLPASKLAELHSLLSSELSSIVAVFAEPTSLLARAEKRVDLPPVNAKKFLAYLEYQPEEIADGIKDLKRFYTKLTSFQSRHASFCTSSY